MSALRLVLIAANAALFASTAYLFSAETARGADFWFGWGLLICFGLNFIYLLLDHQKSNWRIFRLIGLWFDAKESELRRRADQSRQGK
jgi:hypothetical protein